MIVYKIYTYLMGSFVIMIDEFTVKEVTVVLKFNNLSFAHYLFVACH